jgi:hypothetical protein
MTIANKTVVKVETTIDERICLDGADVIMENIIDYLNQTQGDYDGIRLYDTATGEIVDGEEIARARAILQLFLRNPSLEVLK